MKNFWNKLANKIKWFFQGVDFLVIPKNFFLCFLRVGWITPRILRGFDDFFGFILGNNLIPKNHKIFNKSLKNTWCYSPNPLKKISYKHIPSNFRRKNPKKSILLRKNKQMLELSWKKNVPLHEILLLFFFFWTLTYFYIKFFFQNLKKKKKPYKSRVKFHEGFWSNPKNFSLKNDGLGE